MGEVGELRARFEEAKAKAKKRASNGHIAILELDCDGLSLSDNIRWIKVDSREVTEAIKVIHRTEDGRTARERSICRNCEYGKSWDVEKITKRVWVTEDGEIVDKKHIRHYQELNGELIEVEEYKKTKVLKVAGFIDSDKLSNYLTESIYEVYAEKPSDIRRLYRIAEYLERERKIAIIEGIAFRGFKSWWGLLYPVINAGDFVLILALTRMNLVYRHLMKIPTEEAIEEEPSAKAKVVMPRLISFM